MSVKFKETIEQTTGNARGGLRGLDNKRHEFVHNVGEAITKGEGAGGYLQVCASL